MCWWHMHSFLGLWHLWVSAMVAESIPKLHTHTHAGTLSVNLVHSLRTNIHLAACRSFALFPSHRCCALSHICSQQARAWYLWKLNELSRHDDVAYTFFLWCVSNVMSWIKESAVRGNRNCKRAHIHEFPLYGFCWAMLKRRFSMRKSRRRAITA